MTSGERQGPALEIIQTRDIGAADRRDLSYLWEKLVSRKSAGRLYTVFTCLWYAFGAFLAVSILMAAGPLWDTAPDRAVQLIVAALGFAIFHFGAQWIGKRLAWDRYFIWLKAGDRYALDGDGLRWNTARGVHSCRLDKVETIINDQRCLVALLPHNGGLFVVKAAFEGQDVEAFGAELVRRWQAQRGAAGAPA
jgi:hypothetical protein